MEMYFEDAQGKVVASYNGPGKGGAFRKISLRPNEELIGVYGTYRKDQYNFLSRFGFIVKVKQVV